MAKKARKEKVRYAVVGLGHIAQAAVLPAFRGAQKTSELAALVSSSKKKLPELGKRYKVKELHTYDSYEELLRSGLIDAVFIALPNSLHEEYSVKALHAGVHVLCEKPLAPSAGACQRMIAAAGQANRKLMTAYRLHFEPATLDVVKLLKRGAIGEPRIFNSVFSFAVKEKNIRLEEELGGGALLDIGIYCINAARMLFGSEPQLALARTVKGQDRRFEEVEGTAAAILEFPERRLATFSVSLAVSESSYFEVTGTKGSIRMDPAYGYKSGLAYTITQKGKPRTKKFKKVDQFAGEIDYFSRCIQQDTLPEPSGQEGLADLAVIEAIRQSAISGAASPVRVVSAAGEAPSEPREEPVEAEPPQEPPLVDVESPSES